MQLVSENVHVTFNDNSVEY